MNTGARKPLRRHPALQPWSREHHDALMFCLKIRQAIIRHVEPERIEAYIQWTWENTLKSHVRSEESDLFPLLGVNHPMVRRAMKEHERLEELFYKTPHDSQSIQDLERSLEAHIRFEERELFELMQDELSPEVLNAIQHHRSGTASCFVKSPDNPQAWTDPFWLTTN